MILGLSLSDFTLVHVVLSLSGLVAGTVVLIGMLGAHALPRITALFLLTTLGANATGLMFPMQEIGLGHLAGAISLLVLTPTSAAFYLHRLAGAWRWVYVIGATTALWLNAAIGVLQAFVRIPYLQPLALTPIMMLAEIMLSLMFAVLGGLAAATMAAASTSANCRKPN